MSLCVLQDCRLCESDQCILFTFASAVLLLLLSCFRFLLSFSLSLSPLALLHFNISTTHTCTPLYYLSSGSGGSKVVLPVKEKESVCVLVCQICLDFLVFCCRCRRCRCTLVSVCPVLDGLTTATTCTFYLSLSLFTFYCFLSITIFLLSFLLLLWNGADFSVQQQLHFDAGEAAVAWLL